MKERLSQTTKYLAAVVAIGAFASIASAGDVIYSSDFEADDGGWTGSGTGGFAGDWEYEANYDSSSYTGAYVPPPGANSGTGLWGTEVFGDYENSGEESLLSQTFDLSLYQGVKLNFYSWSNVFTTFDFTFIEVNGDLVAGSDGSGAPQMLSNDSGSSGSTWVQEIVDLSAYDGMSSVDVTFGLSATTVVNRAGWYIDDVSIEGTLIPTPGALALLGVAGVASHRRRRR